MPDQTLEILIKMQSDMAALKQSVSEIDNLKQKVKQLESSHVEGARAVHKHAEGHRELHRLMHSVMHVSPLLGLALKAAFSPLGAIFLGGVVALKQLHNALEEVEKKAEETGRTASEAFFDANASTERLNQSMHQVSQTFADWRKNLGNDPKALQTMLEADIKKMEAEAEAIKKLIRARGELTGDKTGAAASEARIDRVTSQAQVRMMETTLGKVSSEEIKAKAEAEHLSKLSLAEPGKYNEAAAKDKALTEAAKSERGKLENQGPGWMKAIALGLLNIIPGSMRGGGIVGSGTIKEEREEYFREKRLLELDKTIRESSARASKEGALGRGAEVYNEDVKKAQKEAMSKATALEEERKALEARLGISRIGASGTAQSQDMAKAMGLMGALGGGGGLGSFAGGLIAGHPVTADIAAKMAAVAAKNSKVYEDFLKRILNALEQHSAITPQLQKQLDDLERRIQTQNTNAPH